MYVSWRWISEFVDTTDVDPVILADRFTLAVAEIEGVEAFGAGLEGVRVARVTEIAPHPNADKLRLATCMVDGAAVTVVCGAPDLAVGGVYPFVPPGVTLPSGIEVRHGEIRGVPSPGMLCSERDLGLSEEHDGLLRLAVNSATPDSANGPDGRGFSEVAGLPDVLWEIDNKSVTHRPDLWGIHGIAREVAALLGRPLRPLDTAGLTFADVPPVALTVAPDCHCQRYVCARIDDVVVAPSPLAARLRLRSLGVRPISNVVDATNLVMLETGNPLHAFDARHVRGASITVRQAKDGEVVRTLDGTDRALTVDDCVITDAVGLVALAGVMGGEDSEIRDDTRAVVLEAASFDGAAIRKTATRQGMRTESSARFEKHLDPNTAGAAARRFLVLIGQLSPGCRISSSLLDTGRFKALGKGVRVITTSADYLRSRLGVTNTEMPDEWIDATFAALGFTVSRSKDDMAVTVPSFRAGRDVSIAEDLVEEVGRIYGYDHVRSATPLVPSRRPVLPDTKRQERDVRGVLTLERGLNEVMLYSFDHEPTRSRLDLAENDSTGTPLPRLALRHALSSESTHLRRTLVSNLLACVETNLVQGTRAEPSRKGLRVGVYELGRVFHPEAAHRAWTINDLDDADASALIDAGVPAVAAASHDGHASFVGRMDDALRAGTLTSASFAAEHPLPSQPRHVAVAIGERLGGGSMGADDVIVPELSLSQSLFREVVGAMEAVVKRLKRPPLRVRRADNDKASVFAGFSWVHPARYGELWCGGQCVGLVTLLHPRTRGRLSVPADVALGQLDLDALSRVEPVSLSAGPPPRMPATTFDLTVHVPGSTRVAELRARLRAAAQAVEPEIVEDVVWIGDFAIEGGRALTYRMVCRHAERTLTDAEIQSVRAAVEAVSA